MEARLSLFGDPVVGKFLKHLISAGKVVSDSTLPAATQELVKIRLNVVTQQPAGDYQPGQVG
ncbi:hypothetical protein SAMN05216276_106218 [Streptosporangium subroseum]|uniref:Uncharacterized protein n=1 Tax=Streptosporangium subroseum TaxID=106412 RepID=A0A239NMI3_9ACTN|nr:hypothetical protein [Streptosporangium subroseum]SNT55663.1 hypothetical protein SAMN05216276_106218 [Streptosporangium subroseum]